MLKPSLSKIERFIEEYEKRLQLASYVAPRWITLIVDPAARETTEGKIAAHIAENPTDKNCNFLVQVLCDGVGDSGGCAVGR
jgi:hypothetical protein